MMLYLEKKGKSGCHSVDWGYITGKLSADVAVVLAGEYALASSFVNLNSL